MVTCVAPRFELNPFKPPQQRLQFSSFDPSTRVVRQQTFVLPTVSAVPVSESFTPRVVPRFVCASCVVSLLAAPCLSLPQSITALGVTSTRNGITSPHVLMALSYGSILSLNRYVPCAAQADGAFVLAQHMTQLLPSRVCLAVGGCCCNSTRLMIDPRRPLGEPSDADKAEQLIKYTSFLPVIHRTVISYNHTIARVAALQSSQTHLESTALVTAVGQ